MFLSLFSYGQLRTGAEQIPRYLPLLAGKRVALAVNQTSTIGRMHLVDSLKKLKVNIVSVFAPEHGFRGNVEAGGHVKGGKDKQTGIQIVSLYGDHRKPTAADLSNVDVVVFDIQDVGVRYYTYISTLHYIMEACAEQGKTVMVLDRPNPNGFYVDGPILDLKFKSFVGMHPVPVVHGLTIGEYARMINGERWLKDGVQCALEVITMQGYDHNYRYILPIKPSPNLPTIESVNLYPSVCLFEGTSLSVGRGTDKPFECIGKPGMKGGTYTFTPKPIKGVADNPPYAHKTCSGHLLTPFAHTVFKAIPGMYVSWVVEAYKVDTAKSKFFTPFFDTLAGSDQLRLQITAGKDEVEIKASWKEGLRQFREIRLKYLLYTDFTVN